MASNKYLNLTGLQTLWTKIKAVFAPKENGVYYVPGTSGYANWSANTDYSVGANVVNPSGECWTCKTAHTSGSSWSSTNWNRISAVALTGTIDGVTALYAGLKIAYRFQVLGGEGSTTLNVNNLGAKTITRSTGGFYRWTMGRNGVAILVYDGSAWRFGDYDSNDPYVLPDAYCSTAAGTQAKAATSTGFNYSFHKNIPFRIYFTNANTYNGNLTLNVNSKGAEPLWINGSASSSSNNTIAAGVYWCYYDGTQFQLWTDGSILAPKGIRGDLEGNASTATSATNVALTGSVKTTSTTNGDTIQFQAGSGTAGTVTIVNAKHAASADSATKATGDSDGNNIKTNYMKASSGNKSLSFGGTTTIGTANGSNVNLVMPAANADTYEVTANSTSFTDTLAAFNAGKKLILLLGASLTGSSAQFRIPLNRVIVDGSTSEITQFAWVYTKDNLINTNEKGVIDVFKLSSSGWTSTSLNVYYSENAGSASYAGSANQLDDWGSTSGTKIAVGWDGSAISKVTANASGSSSMSESFHLAAYAGKTDGIAKIKDVRAINVQVGDAIKWNGWSIVVGSTGSDANTLYFV